MTIVTFIVLLALATTAAAAEGPAPPPRPPDTPLLKAAPKAVFVATMGGFATPDISGRWFSWNARGKDRIRHNPDAINADGKRDIGSVYFPAVGPYDMSDPIAIEYHCQLMKMAGIDGISFNVKSFDDWRAGSMRRYVAAMGRYGLKGIIRFEDLFYYKQYKTRQAAIRDIHADMDRWLKLMAPVQYRIAGRPVFMLFTFYQTGEELAAWKNRYPQASRPLIITRPGYIKKIGPVIDGSFGWCGLWPQAPKAEPPFDRRVDLPSAKVNYRAQIVKAVGLLKTKASSFHMVGVSPGFDDRGCWAWGHARGPRKVERHGGQTYRYRWQQALTSGFPFILIPTWNDWMEGTIIEPSVEFGTQYVEITREYAARFKGTAASKADLRVPLWIYKIRKTTTDAKVLAGMDRASELIRTGAYDKAEALVKPLAEKLKVDAAKYWDPPRRKLPAKQP